MGLDKSWIVYGPQGCGKTSNAKRIAQALGLSRIKDGWDGNRASFKMIDTLHLTNELPRWAQNNRRVMSFDEAMRQPQMKRSS